MNHKNKIEPSPHTMILDTSRNPINGIEILNEPKPKAKVVRKKSPHKKNNHVHHPLKVKKKIEHIVLDLDETLIYAIETSELRSNPELNNYYRENIHKFTHHKLDGDYIITERPGLQTFLDFLFENYKVSVWTAASKDYGIFVIKNVIQKPGRKLEIQMFSEHCDVSKEKTGCLKNLNQLWSYAQFKPHNTLIIDDNKNVINKQNNLVIPAKPFNFFHKNSEKDDFLLRIAKNKILKLS